MRSRRSTLIGSFGVEDVGPVDIECHGCEAQLRLCSLEGPKARLTVTTCDYERYSHWRGAGQH